MVRLAQSVHMGLLWFVYMEMGVKWNNKNEENSFWKVIFNSLAHGRFEWNFIWVSFKLLLVTDDWVKTCEIIPRCMLLDYTDDKSTLVQVMAWWRQATSYYPPTQCWPKSMSPYGAARLQFINFRIIWASGLIKTNVTPTSDNCLLHVRRQAILNICRLNDNCIVGSWEYI